MYKMLSCGAGELSLYKGNGRQTSHLVNLGRHSVVFYLPQSTLPYMSNLLDSLIHPSKSKVEYGTGALFTSIKHSDVLEIDTRTTIIFTAFIGAEYDHFSKKFLIKTTLGSSKSCLQNHLSLN